MKNNIKFCIFLGLAFIVCCYNGMWLLGYSERHLNDVEVYEYTTEIIDIVHNESNIGEEHESYSYITFNISGSDYKIEINEGNLDDYNIGQSIKVYSTSNTDFTLDKQSAILSSKSNTYVKYYYIGSVLFSIGIISFVAFLIECFYTYFKGEKKLESLQE